MTNFFDYDGPQDPADEFEIGTPVILQHPFTGTPRGRGHVIGKTKGLHDFGSPESGPGPVEEVELCIVRQLDGSIVNAYPGDMQDDEQAHPLKWTVEVSVAGQDFSAMIDYPNSDTLAEVKRAGVKLATYLLGQEIGSDGAVTIFKQLAGQERKRDRAFYVYRDDNGAIKVQA
jgi:hypothetical protein